MAKRKKKDAITEPSAAASETVSQQEALAVSPETPKSAVVLNESTHVAETPTDWASKTQREPESSVEPERKSAYPDPNVPFPIVHDNQAGVQLLKSERYKQVQLAFLSPVSGEIEERLAAAGWKYRPEEKVYTKQYGEQGAGASMVEAKRLYDDLVETLLDEKGISRSNAR